MGLELTKRTISSIILIFLSLFVIVKGGIIFNLFILTVLLIALYEWNKI